MSVAPVVSRVARQVIDPNPPVTSSVMLAPSPPVPPDVVAPPWAWI